MRNYLIYTLLMTILIVLGLWGLNFLPTIEIGGHTLRKIDILSEVRKSTSANKDLPVVEIPDLDELLDSTQITTNDSLSVSDSLKSIAQDSIIQVSPKRVLADDKWVNKDTNAEGITHIVDYSDYSLRGMAPFYEALNHTQDSAGYARIAFFGDSFIEGDILTSDLRSYLQTEYGGSGVGYVSITSETNGFRPTVIHSFGGWDSFSVTDEKGFKNKYQGVDGRYFRPSKNAYVELRGQKRYGRQLDSCAISTVFFKNSDTIDIGAQVNKQEQLSFSIEPSADLQSVEVRGSIGRVRWSVKSDSTSLFYGVAMDGDSGIILDNLSLRGSSGYSLKSIPPKNISDFNELRPYDLVVLQYGLNIVSPGVFDYNYYRVRMKQVISYLKDQFPQAGILLLSVGDRDHKNENGVYTTMPEIKYFIQIQRQIAKENNIAFWNMFEAMGGEDSMKGFVNAQPAKANLDYTHINFRGGRVIAKKLFESLKLGKSGHDKGEIYVGE